MKSIAKKSQSMIVIKKSKFLSFLFPLTDLDEVSSYVKEIKEKYKGATHYCYAYLFDSYKKFEDDKEPSKTAGYPILKYLESQKIDHVLCIVVRYFGGIKLGASGLIHAYTEAVKDCLEKNTIVELEKGILAIIVFSYKDLKSINYLLKEETIIQKEFQETICYTVLFSEESFKKKKDLLPSYKEIKETWISKS